MRREGPAHGHRSPPGGATGAERGWPREGGETPTPGGWQLLDSPTQREGGRRDEAGGEERDDRRQQVEESESAFMPAQKQL